MLGFVSQVGVESCMGGRLKNKLTVLWRLVYIYYSTASSKPDTLLHEWFGASRGRAAV